MGNPDPTTPFLLQVPKDPVGLATNATVAALAQAVNTLALSLVVKSSPGLVVNRDKSGQTIRLDPYVSAARNTNVTPNIVGGTGPGGSGSTEFPTGPDGSSGSPTAPLENDLLVIDDDAVNQANSAGSTLEYEFGPPITATVYATPEGAAWVCPPVAGHVNAAGTVSTGMPTGDGFTDSGANPRFGAYAVCDYVRRIRTAYSVTSIVVHEAAAPSLTIGAWIGLYVPGFGSYRGQLMSQASTITPTVPPMHRCTYTLRTWVGTKGVAP